MCYLLKNIPKGIKGTHEKLPEVRIVNSKEVIIEAKEDLPVEYDGEILKGATRLEIKILPQALKIIGQ